LILLLKIINLLFFFFFEYLSEVSEEEVDFLMFLSLFVFKRKLIKMGKKSL